jgi:hypothetical protein
MDGTMTVDNFELSKQLDGEKKALQNERLAMLKNNATLNEKLEQDRARMRAEMQKREKDFAALQADLDAQEKKIHKANLDLETAKVNFGKEKNSLADTLEEIRRQKAVIDKDFARVATEDQKLSEWAEELDDLKERL